ncbi:hypothetical protein Pelo_6034 [Pelomyxa schiedti]|nr:hypothetical protein Pelo_6034 [Pelomyxa schiedti]
MINVQGRAGCDLTETHYLLPNAGRIEYSRDSTIYFCFECRCSHLACKLFSNLGCCLFEQSWYGRKQMKAYCLFQSGSNVPAFLTSYSLPSGSNSLPSGSYFSPFGSNSLPSVPSAR